MIALPPTSTYWTARPQVEALNALGYALSITRAYDALGYSGYRWSVASHGVEVATGIVTVHTRQQVVKVAYQAIFGEK